MSIIPVGVTQNHDTIIDVLMKFGFMLGATCLSITDYSVDDIFPIIELDYVGSLFVSSCRVKQKPSSGQFDRISIIGFSCLSSS